MGTSTATEYVAKQADNPHLAYLNRFANGRFTDAGAVAAKDRFRVGVDNQVEWHLSDTPFVLNYVLVQDGYCSYHLYGVTADEAQDSGPTPQYIQGAAWNALSKDAKDSDFKGEQAIGEVLFFGTSAQTEAQEAATGGGSGWSGGGGCGHGGHGRCPKPTPQPTCHMPHPTPSPCHNVPDDGATSFLLALSLAAVLWVRGKF
jgi:hypothetical protein